MPSYALILGADNFIKYLLKLYISLIKYN